MLALWDIESAFPSLSHDWIWLRLVALGFPQVFIDLVRALYFFNSAHIFGSFAFFVTSGALQGCPLSGFIFATATVPVLEFVTKEIDG